eukprot:m.161258 g.161258  ORF g.161258 m.161258 type:complete len:1031 (-) comp16522_c0_seq1:86-3178(-)
MPSKLDGANFIKHLRVLQNKHDKLVIDFLLGCVAASKDGLTWEELEDIAALNEDLLNAVYAKAPALPATRRVPTAKWSVIKEDLSDFFEEVEVEGCTQLLSFFVEDYRDVVEGELLSDLDLFVSVHRHLAEFFLGTWADDIPKPFTNSQAVLERHRVPQLGQSIRMVASQPLIFPNGTARGVVVKDVRYNKRKLRELPFHLIAACDWDNAVELCFGNFQFMHYSVAVGNVADLSEDFKALPDEVAAPLRPLYRTFRESAHALAQDPSQLMAQFAARLLPMEHETVKTLGYVGEFLEAARVNGSLSDMNFMPKYGCLPSATNHLLSELQVHQHAIHGLACARRANVYATSSDDKSIKLWQYGRAQPLQVWDELEHWIRALVVNRDGSRVIAGGTDAVVTVYDAITGRVLKKLEGHTKYINAVALSQDGTLAASVGEDGRGFVWDLSRNSVKSQFQYDSPIKTIAFIDDGRVVVGSKDGQLRIMDCQTATTLNSLLGATEAISTCTATINGTHIIAACEQYIIRVYSVPGRVAGDVRETDVSFAGHTETVTAVSHVGPGSGLFLTSSLDRTVRLWNFMKRQPVAQFYTVSPVWGVASIISESMAVYSCEDGTKGLLVIHKTLDSVRSAPSYVTAEGQYYQRYSPAPAVLDIQRGKGVALMKEDDANATTRPEVDLLNRYAQTSRRIGSVTSTATAGSATADNGNADNEPKPLSAHELAAQREERDKARAEKRARLKVLMEQELSDMPVAPPATTQSPPDSKGNGRSRRTSDLSGDYGFADPSTDPAAAMPAQEVMKPAAQANTALEAESLVASRTTVTQAQAMFEQGSIAPMQAEVPVDAAVVPSGNVAKVVDRYRTGTLNNADFDTLPRQPSAPPQATPVVTVADEHTEASTPAAEAALADPGFAGLDASQMSAADKQAAFERMVLGESADVLDLEMASLQASPRKQSLSVIPLDSATLQRASKSSSRHSPRLRHSPSAALTASESGEVQHVVSFESSISHSTNPMAVDALTLKGPTSSESEGGKGCCVVS